MRTRTVLIVLWMLAFVVLMGCMVAVTPPEIKKTYPTTAVERYVDEEAGVVCYILENYRKTGGGLISGYGAISCVPMSDTKLVR